MVQGCLDRITSVHQSQDRADHGQLPVKLAHNGRRSGAAPSAPPSTLHASSTQHPALSTPLDDPTKPTARIFTLTRAPRLQEHSIVHHPHR